MEQEKSPPAGPDLTQGVALADFTDDKLAGHVGDDEILLVRSANEIFAIAAHCSHSALRAREIEVHVVAPEKLPRGSRRGGRVMRARRGRWLRWRDGSRHVRGRL